jgi:hypothetical protein
LEFDDMCMFCDLDGPMFGEIDDTPESPEAAEERRRVAQESWQRLMEQLARAPDGSNGDPDK